MNIFLDAKIKNAYSRMTKREMYISDFILKNKLSFDNISITKLSTLLKVSPSAINRWCIKLGFEGFKDFVISVKMKSKFDSKYSDLISTTSKDIMFSIANTESSFNYDDLILAIDEILKRRKIVFYGESFTYLQAEYFARMFQKINIESKVMNVSSDISIIMSNEEVVHIFLSVSGRNSNITRVFNKLKSSDKRNFIISVSANNKTNLSDKVNCELHGNFFQSVDINSIELPIVGKTTIDYILFQLFIHVYMREKENFAKIINSISKNSDY